MAFAAFIPYIAAAISAAGAYSKGQAAANAAEYNAQVADVNKGMALQDQNRQFQISQGRARAGYASSGVQLGSGSPLDVLADAAGQSELDRLKIRYNYDSRANLDRAQASNYRTSSVLDAVGSGMSSYATMRSMGTEIPLFGGGRKVSLGAMSEELDRG